VLREKREPPRKRNQFPYKFINHCWYKISWENSEYWTEPSMKFMQFDFLNNEILNYLDSEEGSDSREDTTIKEHKTIGMTQDMVDSFSESNKRTPSPPTQKEAEPMYHTPTMLINNAMSQLKLTITQPTNFTQAPPLILCLATATMASQMATARLSQRGNSGSGGGGFRGDRGGGGGGGGEGQPAVAVAAAAAVAPNPLRNSLKGIPPTIFQGDTKMFDIFKQE
jgi:hypothetical protein